LGLDQDFKKKKEASQNRVKEEIFWFWKMERYKEEKKVF